MPVVAGLAQRPEPVPGAGVGDSAVDEGAPGFGVVVGHCGWSAAEGAEAVFAQVGAASVLPVGAVAALGGGSSALVAVAALLGPAVGAGSRWDGASAGGADAGRTGGNDLVLLLLGRGFAGWRQDGLHV